MRDLTIILLAAGKSTRFGSPKQLERVGPKGETIAELTLRDAFAHGCTRAVIVARPAHEQHFRGMPGADTRAAVVVQNEALGTAHATMRALDKSAGTVIIANGDDLYGARSMALACEHAINGTQDEHALVAFALGNTLSTNGGVNRAVCRVDEQSRLLSTHEVKGLSRNSDSGIIDEHGRAWGDDVPVSMIGVSITPHSAISIAPVNSPAPFNTAGAAAIGRANSAPGSSSTMAVTPVRAIGSLPSPCHTVTCPTRTPGTSVIALSGPVDRSPNVSPSSRARRRGLGGWGDELMNGNLESPG